MPPSKKPAKASQPRERQERKKLQEITEVIKDAAARFTCSSEVVADFADQCAEEQSDLVGDLAFNRVAHEIWRDRPDYGQRIAEALATFAAERERYRQALVELSKRLATLAAEIPQHEHLEPVAPYEELIRSRIFPNHPSLT